MIKRDKTLIALTFIVIFAFICELSTIAVADNSTATATPMAEPTLTVTPVPTPAARDVFSSPKWETDHVAITVKNAGAPIVVVSWIDSPLKNATIAVGAGETMVVTTPSIQAENGQIVSFGFEAYENGVLIDSYNKTITVMMGPTPTPAPVESVIVSGLVVDADNGTPIVGASLIFRSITYEKAYPAVTTGSDGLYTSPKMYPDSYMIKITASGYQPAQMVTEKITGDTMLDNIQLKRLAAAQTPTPAPSPTPVNPIDSWISLLYSPALCVGTISSLIAVIAGSIGIYEWMERRRLARQKEEAGKNDIKDSIGGIKKP
ncbi:carboxypeptidase-like regulatory domain-containing protein [Methanocella conradii]|uniref:carboxypeptidase-like regulatory domain-containing protein n=1 Tax=Methanocella conradii TaxID=1175444 RepID=UPI0024B3298A|nr:carboxypeptidase-like regulatory domain-containing protein [Methanocella conradii]MDI6896776.1 carboxypeptidase-like regulatory domain-containing protein [Methanocella conradii]